MAEHLVKTLCHIVFILKLYSKFLLGLFRCPAYLQLAPLPEELCSSGNAADYQRLIGIMGLSPLRGSLRAAPSKKRRKYHYTRHLHRRKQPHHTAVIALRRSLTPFGRSWRRKLCCFAEAERSAALNYSVFKEQRSGLIDPFTLQRTSFCRLLSTAQKIL